MKPEHERTMWCGCEPDPSQHLGPREARARARRMEQRGALAAGVDAERVVGWCGVRGRYRMEPAAERSPRRVAKGGGR